MPLYNFRCIECKKITEKFLKNSNDDLNISCECGSKKFEKVCNFGVSNRTWKDPCDNLENNILPEVDRISEQLESQKETTFVDICGE